jgi:putative transposase
METVEGPVGTPAVAKLRLEVHAEADSALDGASRICNWLYNELLEVAGVLRARYRLDQDAATGTVLYTERGLRNLVPELKRLYPFLPTVHSSPLKNAALRVSDSIRRHQAAKHGRRKGKAVGWPRFRAWKAGPRRIWPPWPNGCAAIMTSWPWATTRPGAAASRPGCGGQ